MLRHAQHVTQPARLRGTHPSAYVIVSCPGDEYARGASFDALDLAFGLKAGAFPDGLVFQLRGGRRYTVRGGMLVDERGARHYV